jgi:CubicO group peptidase (beta-lactamase class C family)
VVQDGAVVLAKGYGAKHRGARGKVGPHTLFMIGSVGKSLTALMMAHMIDEGRFGWDTPVTTVMPAFAIGDAATTKRLAMRHMLCACSGIPSRPDIELSFEIVSAEERLALMKSMIPTTDLGESFQYSDVMVAAGGFVAAHAYSPKKRLLPAYTEAMQTLVFEPLGMKSTTFDFKRVARADHAAPHPLDVRGEAIAVAVDAERWTLPVAPAGAVWSSAHDMARYLALELGTGKLDGEQIVSEQQVLARRKPQVKIDVEASYGLAWGIGKRSGLDTIEHGGGTYGFSSLLQMFPEHGVGIVILANTGGADLFNSVVHRRFLELLFDGKAEAKDILTTGVKLDAEARAEALDRLSEADPDWFDGLAGGWVTPVLGRIDLARDEQGATLDVGEWRVKVGKRTGKDGTISLVTTGVPVVGVELVPRERDGRTVLVISSDQQEYVFERVKQR